MSSTEIQGYTLEQRVQGLIALARFNGNPALAEEETGIPAATLSMWKGDPEYRETRERFQSIVEQEFVKQAREVALLELEVERRAAERTLKALKDEPWRVNPRDAAQIANNMAKAKGANIDKVLTLTGRPKEIVQHDFQGIVESLVARRVLTPLPETVESTAEEDA